MNLFELGAVEAARRVRDGEASAEELVHASLARIEELEPDVQAWAHLDPDYALKQAQALDELRQRGAACGPLHGVPVGVKDIFDTSDFPTENGTVLDSGRQPQEDSRVVALLRQAGAVIMGKTVTTELAVYSPNKTRNPHNIAHTPGGSSSGSAAAVAAGMVPLALGSQTNGSIIRPASYCGVCGFKPSHGSISRTGVLALSRSLDTIGVFARDVADLALIAEVLAAFDERDPDMRPHSRLRLREVAVSEPPVDPVLAFVKSQVWDQTEEDCRHGFSELVSFLGEGCDEVDLPEPFDQGIACHSRIMVADLAESFAGYCGRGADQLSPTLRGLIEEGQATLALDYKRALQWREVLNAGLDKVFDRYDAILTPAASGEAPQGLEFTGSPAFCSLWTLCGVPAVSLPLLSGARGLPVGVQLVGRRGDDARLLRTARWLMERAREDQGD